MFTIARLVGDLVEADIGEGGNELVVDGETMM